MTHKYYRFVDTSNGHKDTSSLSLKLKSITGYYANDYIKPVVHEGGDIITIIADESEFKGHFCSGLIVFPYIDTTLQNQLETELENLISNYRISKIHFTDIFGKKKILKNNTINFINDYSNIVKKLPMSCLSISKSKSSLLIEIGASEMNNSDIFFTLFWNNLQRIIPALQDHSIVHISMEQEYNLEPKSIKMTGEKLFTKLYSGIDQLYSHFPNKYISICKHPNFFTKKALHYSSLSDFLAYSTNKIQNKIDIGISHKKIMSEYGIMLRLLKTIFINYSGLSSDKMIELINLS